MKQRVPVTLWQVATKVDERRLCSPIRSPLFPAEEVLSTHRLSGPQHDPTTCTRMMLPVPVASALRSSKSNSIGMERYTSLFAYPQKGKHNNEEILEKARKKKKERERVCEWSWVQHIARSIDLQLKPTSLLISGNQFITLPGEVHQLVIRACSLKFCSSLSAVHKWFVIYFFSEAKTGQSKNKFREQNHRIAFRSLALDNF